MQSGLPPFEAIISSMHQPNSKTLKIFSLALYTVILDHYTNYILSCKYENKDKD